jgi:4-diphosphocytidyl-2-C-methyl-D-erythritol kinase
VATSEAYGWLDEDRAASLPDATRDRRPVDVGWPAGPVPLVNDLEAPVARRHPAVLEMIDACLREGALSAAMTGSGSAVYSLFPEPAARRAARRLQRADWLVILTRTLSRREAARRMGL